MHACGDPGVPCDALQHADEPGPVGLIERGKQFGIVLVGRPLGSRQESAGLPGEVNGVGTPVTWVTPTLHQTSILEIVDQPHHEVAVDAECIGEVLLGLPVRRRQVGEQAEMPGLQPEWRAYLAGCPG